MNIEGTLKHFNYSPNGGYEAMILTTKKGVVQVNFHPTQATVLAARMKVGGNVNVNGELVEGARGVAHPVYELACLEVLGKPLRREPAIQVKGRVARLNHSRHGEVNGAVLDTGDFVHLKPKGARALNLAVGQTLQATGPAAPLLHDGPRAIKAEKANGVDLTKLGHAKKAPKKAARKPIK